jgi:flagellar hook protein FlgE
MSFGTALSGIDAAQTALDVVSNNIANSSTTGFKSSTANFSDIYAASQAGLANTQVGEGAQVSQIEQQFTQGNIETTGNALDLAISGEGYFAVGNNGAISYTRAGSFQTNAAGFVMNAAGQKLQVFPPTTNGNFNTSTLTDLQLQTSDNAPSATTNVDMTVNLPASSTVIPAVPAFDANTPSTYTNTTSATVYDSLGAAHTASVYFSYDGIDAATGDSQWTANLTVDGQTTGTPQTLEYSSNGTLVTPAAGAVDFGTYTPTTGAAPMAMNFNFSTSTQYGDSFAVNSITQNGYTTGQLSGVSVGTTGIVQANFTNGQSVDLGQVALATFADPNGLAQLANTGWAQTADSGQALMGTANTGSFGEIQAGSLEQSNVDVTAQLVDMITAQRAFQSNAQMISTQDQITQTIINIRNG